MSSPLPSRYWVFALSLIACAIGIALREHGVFWIGLALIGGVLSAVGIHDVLQRRHTLLRNFPITGHGRYLMESVRPALRQYVVEGDKDEVPFSHDQRSIV